MTTKKVEAQYRGTLKHARNLHDSRFEIDHPKPKASQQAQETRLEQSVGYLWIAWFVLALAGAVISLPHTLGTVLSTLGIDGLSVENVGSLIYAGAVFVGVELALISVALVVELSHSEKGHQSAMGKQASLAGLINRLAQRIGMRPPFDLSHLPDRTPGSGLGLVALLFLAALTFNLADALFADLPTQASGVMATLAAYHDEVILLSRMMAGILGPGLLLIAGHRFAQEVVRAAGKRQRREHVHGQASAQWESERDASWLETGDAWIKHITGESQDTQPRPFLAPTPEAVTTNGSNGKH